MRKWMWVAVLLVSFGCQASKRGEFYVAGYVGKASHEDADLNFQDAASDVVYHDVRLADESTTGPIYYGLRAGYWMKELPEWGFMVDFTHPKAITDTSQVTTFAGQRNGSPVGGVAPLSTDFQAFAMSHGYNFLTLNFMRRWFPTGKRDNTFWGRMQPYAGIGAGAAIPHVEANVGGVMTSRFDSAGWTMQGIVGVNFDIWGPISAFLEYKGNYAVVDVALNGGSRIALDTWTHQFIIGLAVRF